MPKARRGTSDRRIGWRRPRMAHHVSWDLQRREPHPSGRRKRQSFTLAPATMEKVNFMVSSKRYLNQSHFVEDAIEAMYELVLRHEARRTPAPPTSL